MPLDELNNRVEIDLKSFKCVQKGKEEDSYTANETNNDRSKPSSSRPFLILIPNEHKHNLKAKGKFAKNLNQVVNERLVWPNTDEV